MERILLCKCGKTGGCPTCMPDNYKYVNGEVYHYGIEKGEYAMIDGELIMVVDEAPPGAKLLSADSKLLKKRE